MLRDAVGCWQGSVEAMPTKSIRLTEKEAVALGEYLAMTGAIAAVAQELTTGE